MIDSKRRSARWARYPPAPKGRGPVLEWFQPTVWDLALSTGVTTSGLFILGVSLKSAGIHWLRDRRAALITAAVGFCSGAVIVADSLLPSGRVLAEESASAGADWLAVSNQWVDTYELTEVDTDGGVVPHVVLTDRAERTIRINIVALQSNSALWDLVHNGIMHSARHGGVVSARAREDLRLDGLPFPE